MDEQDVTAVPAATDVVLGSYGTSSDPLNVEATESEALEVDPLSVDLDAIAQAEEDHVADQIQASQIAVLEPEIVVRRLSADPLQAGTIPNDTFNAARAMADACEAFLTRATGKSPFAPRGRSKIWIISSAKPLKDVTDAALASALAGQDAMADALRSAVVKKSSWARTEGNNYFTTGSDSTDERAVTVAGHPGDELIRDAVWSGKQFWMDRARERLLLHELFHAVANRRSPLAASNFLKEGTATQFEYSAYQVTVDGQEVTSRSSEFGYFNLYAGAYEIARTCVDILANIVDGTAGLYADSWVSDNPAYFAVFEAVYSSAREAAELSDTSGGQVTAWTEFSKRVAAADEQIFASVPDTRTLQAPAMWLGTHK